MTGNHIFSIDVSDMEEPHELHIDPDYSMLVLDCGCKEELRKYEAEGDSAQLTWTLRIPENLTGVTSDKFCNIYVLSLKRDVIYQISPTDKTLKIHEFTKIILKMILSFLLWERAISGTVRET